MQSRHYLSDSHCYAATHYYSFPELFHHPKLCFLASHPRSHGQIQCHEAFTLCFYEFQLLQLGLWPIVSSFLFMVCPERRCCESAALNMPANLENSAVATGLENFISNPKRGNAKECSNYHTIALISHASKVMLKLLQAKIQQYVNRELSDV